MKFILKILNRTTCGPYWVMYDSECGLCYRVTRFFKRFDIFNKIQWIDKDFKGDFPDQGRNRINDSRISFRDKADTIVRVPFGLIRNNNKNNNKQYYIIMNSKK